MVMLGCKPEGRYTEQHDIFFGIADSLKALVPQMHIFWKEAKGKLHIDAWREVTQVDGYNITVVDKQNNESINQQKLFFINLGGYKQNEFEEYHYKLLIAAEDMSKAIQRSKETAFYKHCGFKNAVSHIDDKYGIDVDDVYEVADNLVADVKNKFRLNLIPASVNKTDELHIGYLNPDKNV